MPELSRLIDRARAARVAEDDARAYVAELGRWARVQPEPRRVWSWWLGGGLALAAAAIVLILVRTRAPDAVDSPEVAIEALQIGSRVALVVDPGTRWHVVAADADHTEILVEQGTVTARLFRAGNAHRLALRGAKLSAFARGTVYSLTVDDRGGSVEVHEGIVEVARDDAFDETFDAVHAGDRWPATTPPRASAAAETLLALEPPAAAPQPSRAPVIDAAEPPPIVDARSTQTTPTNAPEPPAPTLTDRWRQARLLRGQGNFEAAIRECLAIADARDPTWSPIALIEAARIELGPRASPERTISLADRFLAEWGTHQLAPEARELRCRALRQLGREAECAPPP